MDCQSYLLYTVIDMTKKTSRAIASKTLKHTGFIIVALVLSGGLIFAFTRPMLAPGSDLRTLGNDGNATETVSGDTFGADNPGDSNPSVGKDVKANSYLIFDETTGDILASRNPKTPVAIASLTKLMTAFVTQKYGNLEDVWAIGSNSTGNVNPLLGLKPGDRVIVKDLVNAMLIGSANDAAAALGAYVTAVADTSVIDLMNNEAKELGMNSTHYENPIGFDSEQNYSTANDLKLLLSKIRPMPLFSEIDRKQSYSFTSETGQTYSVKATNILLALDPDIHAIKTGYTDEAQGAMITAIHHLDRKFIIIVLGSSDRENDTKLLKSQILQ